MIALDHTVDQTVDHITFVRLLRRNAAVFQAVFAVLWLVRLAFAGSAINTGAGVIGVTLLAGGTFTVVTGTRLAWRRANDVGVRARDAFRTPAGRAFMRPVTVITLVQLAGSIVLPWIAAAAGATEWVVPLVAITIGLFLVAFATPLQVPRVRWAGVVATIVPALVPLVAHGAAAVVAVSATLGAALIASVWWCAVAPTSDPSASWG